MASQATFGFLVDQRADFPGVGRVDNLTVLAQNPDPVDIVLGTDILDDFIDVRRLVLQHGEARAFNNDLGQLGRMRGHLRQQLLAAVSHHHEGEKKYRNGQGGDQVDTDLDL